MEDFVHVFDWSGALLAVFELDHDAVGMAVSPDERTLYTLIHDPLPAVMAYPLASR